jgi:4-hydroxybenzoate polyprenyltransferase
VSSKYQPRTPPWPDPEWDRVSPWPPAERRKGGRPAPGGRQSLRPATVVLILCLGMAAVLAIPIVGLFLTS